MTGIYIHVPFCKRKCPYCDFYSVCRPELYEDYTQAVCRNIEAFKGLTLYPEHDIAGDVPKSHLSRRFHSRLCLRKVMKPAQEAKLPVISRLNAKRKPCYPCFSPP